MFKRVEFELLAMTLNRLVLLPPFKGSFALNPVSPRNVSKGGHSYLPSNRARRDWSSHEQRLPLRGAGK